MEESVAGKDNELKLLKSSMKFTLIKELQIEAQTYFNEARRLKRIVDLHAAQEEQQQQQQPEFEDQLAESSPYRDEQEDLLS
jgi:hypothetical protein